MKLHLSLYDLRKKVLVYFVLNKLLLICNKQGKKMLFTRQIKRKTAFRYFHVETATVTNSAIIVVT